MNNLVSIIMPSYNCAKYIETSILSVLSQVYTNWELIVTDDNSNDNTLEIIKQYASSGHNINFFTNQTNMGAAYCRNNSIKNANGRFIAFLDSDDYWHPNKLSMQIEFMQINNYKLTHTYYSKLWQSGRKSLVKSKKIVSYNDMLYTNHIGCLTAIYDSSQLGKIYMPNIRKRQDWGLWLKIMKCNTFSFCLPTDLATYRFGTGMTKNKFAVLSEQYKFYRNTVKLKGFSLYYYFFFYMLLGFKKYYT